MPAIKDPATIAAKWDRVVQTRTADYAEGIENPKADWKQSTLAAAPAQAAGVQAAIANKSFEKGVSRSSTEAWKSGARTKGVRRWPEGVAEAKDKYAANFAPFANVIRSTTLPPRGPVGSPANYQRSQKMGEALHTAKMQRTS